jgi:MerR family mercuric resistance operon transcriptional regulator
MSLLHDGPRSFSLLWRDQKLCSNYRLKAFFSGEEEPEMSATSGWLPIGALSKRTGCKVETIRFYERARLLSAPAQSPGGYRLYSNDHLKRLTFFGRARALGFSVDEVRKLLKLADDRKRPCAEVRVVATSHLEDVRGKIADLRAMERLLSKTVAKYANGTRTGCALIEALYRQDASPGPASPRRNRHGLE